ncbi:MAG: hydroxymethylbilane synthase [Chitinophagaceae bacterium]|jgi:hydroxymethylbilane synthase
MQKRLKIGTRESQLAVWQATTVKNLLAENGVEAELVYIKSEGDIDLTTPLYEMGVTGVFTRSLDIALLNKSIDIAVHSMKDVPTQLPKGIVQSAVLQRGSHKDIFVFNGTAIDDVDFIHQHTNAIIATSSIRRKAQWLQRFPNDIIENLRGNVNTRLRKVNESNWRGAIFAAAGLERIQLRPENSVDLDWMLPAPAQGAVMVVCRLEDDYCLQACAPLNHATTATCVKIERDFLRTLMGGCSTPISAYASLINETIAFEGNIVSPNGDSIVSIEKNIPLEAAEEAGSILAKELLHNGAQAIVDKMNHAK